MTQATSLPDAIEQLEQAIVTLEQKASHYMAVHQRRYARLLKEHENLTGLTKSVTSKLDVTLAQVDDCISRIEEEGEDT